jgi:hypothetical protein
VGGQFLSSTGTLVFSGTTSQQISGGQYPNVTLRNGGTGNPKLFIVDQGFTITGDLTVEATAQLGVSGADNTHVFVDGNLFFLGLGGGTNIANLVLHLSGEGKVIGGSPAALVTPTAGVVVEGETPGEPPVDPGPPVPQREFTFRTDPSKAAKSDSTVDGKPMIVYENTYAQRKATGGQPARDRRSLVPARDQPRRPHHRP